jgi:hypothetical protein
MYLVIPAVVVLIVAGSHVPDILLLETPGNEGATLFWQSGSICVNAGEMLSLIVIVRVAGSAHCPASGVKV